MWLPYPFAQKEKNALFVRRDLYFLYVFTEISLKQVTKNESPLLGNAQL